VTVQDLPFPYRALAWLSLFTAILLVYGSLVPFEFRALPLAAAIDRFAHIPWLDIVIEERADWVANLILYVPFGFVLCGALSGRSLFLAMLLTAVSGTLLAVGIEFLQIWAEPRTVSLNDIAAEIAGTLLGIAAWASFGRRLVRAAQVVLRGGPQALPAALIFYLLAYCFITLFPFDFLVSAAELHARLADPDTLVWLPRTTFSLRGIAALGLKAALLAPLGMALWLVWGRGALAAAAVALTLSGLLELAHLFEYSEQTDALSLVAAMVGAVAGNLLARSPVLHERRLLSWVRGAAFLAAPLYLALLPIARGWRGGHVSRALIANTIATTHWLPFYYHYFTSEGHALASVVSISASFAPLGALAWAMRLEPNAPRGQTRSVLPVAIVAFVLANGLEIGGLITAGNRPDPTNVLIAMAVAVFAQRVCEWLERVIGELPVAAR